VGAYALVFPAFVFLERPGLGVGHFFYIPIGLLALASGPRIGVLAGAVATVLFAAGVFLNPYVPPSDLATAGTAIRLITFVLAGSVLGWFASRNRALFASLQELAYRDFLTALPNARAFEDEISHRIALEDTFVLLLVDADGLKTINDEKGHQEGDRCIRDVSDALRRATRREDHVSRLGGDEFAVIASAHGYATAAEIGERLEASLQAVGRSASIGFANYPDDGRDREELYRAADRRLYERKPSRRSKAPALHIVAGENPD
jgi:diguanylate cyclase (GGDEF)-like protein